MNPRHPFPGFGVKAKVLCSLALVMFAVNGVSAALADYLVDKWDTEDGLPSSTVTSIEQTPDGYLWVGTYNGLARFDGSRFVVFDPVSQPELTQTRVQGLFLDANGTLWINTFRGGLTSYRNGRFRCELPDQPSFDLHTSLVRSTTNLVVFATQFGDVFWRHYGQTNWLTASPPTSAMRPIFQCADQDGQLWFLTRDGHIVRFINGEFQLLPNDGGLAGGKIFTLVNDSQGRVWAGAENEIALWDGTQFVAQTPTNSTTDIEPRALYPLRSGAFWVLDGDRVRKMDGRTWVAEITAWRGLLGPASGRAMGFHEDRSGGVWFNHYGNGLFHIAPDGKYQRITSSPNNQPSDHFLPSDRVNTWFQSADDGIWVGVDHGGLARLRDRLFSVIGPAEGLPARTALSVSGNTNGLIWIGTAGGGLCSWENGRMNYYSVGGSASANMVFSVAERADGVVWMSAGEGEDLYQLRNGRVQRVFTDVHGVKVIFFDRQNRVWAGLKAGLACWFGEQRQILNTSSNGFLPAMRAFAETPDGKVWAGADDGTLFQCATNGLTPWRAEDALAGQPIYSLYAETNGTLWCGTFRGGLLRFKDGQFARITARQGLPVDVISQILEDDHDRLWLGTHKGLFCVSKAVLNACADGRANTVDYRVYSRHEGLPSLEFSDGYQPACWRDLVGRLWFSTVRGAVWVDPDKLTRKSAPPPVVIEEARIDGDPVSLSDHRIIIPPGRSQLDIRYTALSFDAGDQSRFRYRLEGFDPGWVDAETLRTAHYANLPPRNYLFRVIACNNEGVWNEVGATVSLTVEPYFYQTTSFFILVSSLVIGGVAFGVRRAATRKYRRKLAAMEKQAAIERDRARIAKDIHDDIGAGLTQITLLTELARREPSQTEANLGRITDSARRLTKAMDEIVWAVDPQHDTVAGLMDYASAYAEDFLRTADIRCRMDLPVSLPLTRVDAESRYNLFLALKETLNNIVKHSRASEVWLRLKIEINALTLIVEDNGRGLAGESHASDSRIISGAGLGNLEKRLASVGGRCEIHSEPGRGTRVELTILLKPGASPVVAIEGNDSVT